MNGDHQISRRNATPQWLNPWLIVAGTSLALLVLIGCSKNERAHDDKPATQAPVKQTSGVPEGVDANLYRELQEASQQCQINLRDSEVACTKRNIERLSEQIVQGARSQSHSLETIAYALAQTDPKLVTVAAQLLYDAYRAPAEDKNSKAISKGTALNLIHTLAKLPSEQAADAAPAITYAAFATDTAKELYATVDNHVYTRLPGRTYKYLMAAGGMRAWDKVKALLGTQDTETYIAALDAPSMMLNKTDQERVQICDWYRALADDERPLVVGRASGYLIVCGPKYIEQLLVADEARLKDKSVKKLGLDAYRQMCTGMIAASGPTREQCTRFRKLLTTAIADTRFDPYTRKNAITLLTVNFIDKQTVTFLKKYTAEQPPMLGIAAQQSIKQIESQLAAQAATLQPASRTLPAD